MKQVKLIVMDVDGTLTDGVIHYDGSGDEHKHFHAADGLGIVMAQAVGIHVAVISGRSSAATERRLSELKIADVISGESDKASAMRGLMNKYALSADQVAYIGDDINDLPAYGLVSNRIAVADASEFVRAQATWTTKRTGGHGAVRDAIEEILRRQGRLDQAVSAYLALGVKRPAEARQ